MLPTSFCNADVLRRAAAMASTALLAACGQATTGVEDIGSLTIDPIAGPLNALGWQVAATVDLRDSDGNVLTGVPITWSTSDASVVSVSAGGLVTAQGNGTAFVRAAAGSFSDSAQVVVDQVVQSVSVSFPFDTLLTLGVRARLSVAVTDSNGMEVAASHAARSWTTSDAQVATVDDEGRVTPHTAGFAAVRMAAGGVESVHTFDILPLDDLAVDVALAEQLQWALEDALPSTEEFGVTGVVILENGDEWVASTGWSAPGSRLRPGAITALGSIAKSVAGAVLLSVIDDGTVGLDDPVSQWLPELPNVTPEATMRQLLNNSSGIANYGAHPAFGDSVFADTSRLWTHTELMERFVGPAEFAPGERYKSSNTGFVLGLMTAVAATGQDHRTLTRERVFGPLGLDESIHMPPWEERTATVLPGWFMDGSGQLVDFTPFMSTSLLSARAIGVMASTRAMAVFFREFVAGDLFSPALRDEALTAIPDDGLIPGQDGAGLGLRRYNYLGGRQWGHSGAVSNGSGIVFHDVDLGVTVAVLFNVNPPAHQNVHFTLAPRMLEIVRDGGV